MDLFLGLSAPVLRMFRLGRIGRVLRSLNCGKGLQNLLSHISQSLPALLNIFNFFFVILLVYSLMGMYLFGHIENVGALDDVFNFDTLKGSMMVVFEVSQISHIKITYFRQLRIDFSSPTIFELKSAIYRNYPRIIAAICLFVLSNAGFDVCRMGRHFQEYHEHEGLRAAQQCDRKSGNLRILLHWCDLHAVVHRS